ncbi:hypothetical protein IGK28_002610 [Enterococcus sp. DIV0182]|uniref:hypothetical protein n=1 Tax=Enterococcus TaxID=1350 RepID=UPI0039A47D71
MNQQNIVKYYREKLGYSKEKLVLLVQMEALLVCDPIEFDVFNLEAIENGDKELNYGLALILSYIFSVDIEKLMKADEIFAYYKFVIESVLSDLYLERDLNDLKMIHDFFQLDYLTDI